MARRDNLLSVAAAITASVACAACSAGGGGSGADGGLDGGSTDAAGGDDSSVVLPDGRVIEDASSGDGDTGDPDAGPVDCTIDRPDVSSPPESASWRYGGGVGYPDRIEPHPECVTIVRTRAELEAALDGATEGDVVYVAGEAQIDLTEVSPCIPGGVTLASGRGADGSPGGLLYKTEVTGQPILRTCGDDVRITGLRIRGADRGQCPPEWPDDCEGEDRTGGVNCRDCMPVSRGIRVTGNDRAEIDNCDLSGWSASSIAVSDAVDVHIHHNHMHHNQRQGLGYGVVFGRDESPATSLIEWNRFDYNRHAIAASGEPATSYEASHNLALSHANGHVFDCHGHDENTDNGSPYAGNELLFHHNTVLPSDHYAVVIRGRPKEGAWIWDNCLARSSADTAVRQRHFFGDMHVDEAPDGSTAANAYGQSAGECETTRFCSSPGARGTWRYLAASGVGLGSLGFGDFDGDGTTDVFRTSGGTWHWLPSGTGSWMTRNSSSIELHALRFGDFDGDGRTDVFRATGSEWVYSAGGADRWSTLRSASATADELGFADFDGDGATDVFRATGSEWQVSWGASSAWMTLNVSSTTLGDLAFADFDGDGQDDVFSQSGGEWRISSGGTGRWSTINASGVGVSSLTFGDFDGDGRADVLNPNGTDWLVSWGGESRWQVLAVASERLGDFALGDFDGDGRTDAFRAGCL